MKRNNDDTTREESDSGMGQYLRFFMQYLLFPLSLAIVAFIFDQRLQDAERKFQTIQLEVHRLEAAQKFTSEMFSETYERGLVSLDLFKRLVADKELSDAVEMVFVNYWQAKTITELGSGDTASVNRRYEAASSIGTSAGNKMLEELYYVIVSSPYNENLAIERAKAYKEKGYNVEVHLSSSGAYGVAIGKKPYNQAKELMYRAIKKGDVPKGAYLMTGKRWVKRVYP